eukprot:CAMPEP_0204825160 /NCGR_PEP_ID=MMETSP1346-20131115/3094_1 /ASSEMBLY_ACC=CAM_ASM_000771 /TAXON_ID=215587 /ORGANISM="Aplanochytrium stocchinoi, Strain GSBS06" /LENGTH=471 /DNA_ID=CAMNT_0051952683 /DNA_START=417 /DNA_END=1832 /DNA_ORIENTATION=+
MATTSTTKKANGNISTKSNTKETLVKSSSTKVAAKPPNAPSLKKGATPPARTPAQEKNDQRIKGPWTREEDALLSQLVKEYGPKKWSIIASHVKGRIGKQCRERWLNHLDSSVKKTPWTELEDETLLRAQERVGNRWCEIAKRLPGRPENAVKNRWNSLMNRRWSQKMHKHPDKNGIARGDFGPDGRPPRRRPGRPPKSNKDDAVMLEQLFNQLPPHGRKQKMSINSKEQEYVPPKLTTTPTASGSDSLFFSNEQYVVGSSHTFGENEERKPWDSMAEGLGDPRAMSSLMDHSIDPLPFDHMPNSPSHFAAPRDKGPYSQDRLINSIERLNTDFDYPLFEFPNSARGNGTTISNSMLNLSIDDECNVGLKELFDMPLAPTPKGAPSLLSPRNGIPLHSSRGEFRFDDQHIHRASGDTFSFTPKPTKCMSPTAHRLKKITKDFQDGRISKEEKDRMKDNVLRESVQSEFKAL